MADNIPMSVDTLKTVSYFNQLTADPNDDAFFPSQINKRSKENPNGRMSPPCQKCGDSLDDYARQLTTKMLVAFKVG